MSTFSPELVTFAAQYGIMEDELSKIINGCSGGMSRFYRLALHEEPSCECCCQWHDLRYYIGGSESDRKRADKALRRCAAQAGKSIPGWLEKLRLTNPRKALWFCWVPYARKTWRWLRSWVMYGAVRIAGKSHWG